MRIVGLSNPICIGNHCDTVVLKYSDNKDVFDFEYTESPEGFEQQIRIPATLQNPKHPRSSGVYRKSNGQFVQFGVAIDKSKTLLTDWMDEIFTDALTTASGHKNFSLDDVPYSGHGDIEENPNEEDNLIQTSIEVYEQGYNQTNISC